LISEYTFNKGISQFLSAKGDMDNLIASATLYDLLGAKVLASLHFTQSIIADEFLQNAVSEYYSLIEEDATQKYVTTKIGERAVSVLKVGDVTVLIIIGDSDVFSEKEIINIKKLDWHVSDEIERTSVRDFKEDFEKVAETHLRIPVNICIVTVTEPPPEDVTTSAVELMVQNTGTDRKSLSHSIRLGPYLIRVTQYHYDEITSDVWPKVLSSFDAFAVVVSGLLSEGDRVDQPV